jgi:hypothetical protein
MSQQLIAHMLSGLVDLVSDLRMGESPRSTRNMRVADLAVERRDWVRGEKWEG